MDAELRRRLLKEFEPEVEELSSLLGPSVCCEGHSVVGIVTRGDPTADNIRDVR